MKSEYTEYVTIHCGRLLWKHLREMLDSEIWTGTNIEYREGKGFWSRDFHIKGYPLDVHRVANRIRHWLNSVEAS